MPRKYSTWPRVPQEAIGSSMRSWLLAFRTQLLVVVVEVVTSGVVVWDLWQDEQQEVAVVVIVVVVAKQRWTASA